MYWRAEKFFFSKHISGLHTAFWPRDAFLSETAWHWCSQISHVGITDIRVNRSKKNLAWLITLSSWKGQNLFYFTLKLLTRIFSKTVRDRGKVSTEVRYEIIYGLSNGISKFDLRWPLKVKSQGQSLKYLKSNISKTVRDREKVSTEVR